MDETLAKRLRARALGHPGVEETTACKGTALESAAFKTGKKTFLFLGETHVRFKLGDSLSVAKELATREPERYEVGSQGWVKVTLSPRARRSPAASRSGSTRVTRSSRARRRRAAAADETRRAVEGYFRAGTARGHETGRHSSTTASSRSTRPLSPA